MSTLLQQTLLADGLLNSEEIQSLIPLMQREVVPAKTRMIDIGATARKIYFIESGLLRTYTLSEKQETNTYFACDGQFITSYRSFIGQVPSIEVLESIEESICYSMSFDTLSKLYLTSPRFEKMGRVIAEKNYLCVVDRIFVMQTKTAKERYIDFTEKYSPKIVQNLPLRHIASYLGIAPESLSRIRKQLSIS